MITGAPMYNKDVTIHDQHEKIRKLKAKLTEAEEYNLILKKKLTDRSTLSVKEVAEMSSKLKEAESCYEMWKSNCLVWNSRHDALDRQLKVAVTALNFVSQNASCPHMEDIADKALEKIKGQG